MLLTPPPVRLFAELFLVGVWHVEGMPTEQIIASAILYYESSPVLEDDGLMFRRERDEENDFPGYNDCTKISILS